MGRKAHEINQSRHMDEATTDTKDTRNKANKKLILIPDRFTIAQLLKSKAFFLSFPPFLKFLKPINTDAHSIKHPKANIKPLPENHPDIWAPKIAPGKVARLKMIAALMYTFFCLRYAIDPEMALHITEKSDVPTTMDGDHSGNQYKREAQRQVLHRHR